MSAVDSAHVPDPPVRFGDLVGLDGYVTGFARSAGTPATLACIDVWIDRLDASRRVLEQLRQQLVASGAAALGATANPLVVFMLERLAAAGIVRRSAAEALSVDERDRALGVVAWGGDEDEAWQQTLDVLGEIGGAS